MRHEREEVDRRGDSADGDGRRRFLHKVAVGAASVATLLAGVPFVSFILAPLRGRSREVWRDVGAEEDFPVGSTRRVIYPDPEPDPWSGTVVRNAAWLRRDTADTFVAFSIYCTHTGCPVRWLDDAELFLCPCHGGAFDRDGSVVSGPPPQPLERPGVRVREGRVEIAAIGVPTFD